MPYYIVSSGVTSEGIYLYDNSSMNILSGGTAINTLVSSGGSVFVSSGGVLENVYVGSLGSAVIFSGGKLTGRVIVRPTGQPGLAVEEGAIVDFDFTHTLPGAAPLYYLDKLSASALFLGSPTFTITVTADQAEGRFTKYDNTLH